MTGDITRATLEALAAVRHEPTSAYKLGMHQRVHYRRAIKLLAVAAELGFIEQCGHTRKRHPVYRWKRLPACPVCKCVLPEQQ